MSQEREEFSPGVGSCRCPLASFMDVGEARFSFIDHQNWAPSASDSALLREVTIRSFFSIVSQIDSIT